MHRLVSGKAYVCILLSVVIVPYPYVADGDYSTMHGRSFIPRLFLIGGTKTVQHCRCHL